MNHSHCGEIRPVNHSHCGEIRPVNHFYFDGIRPVNHSYCDGIRPVNHSCCGGTHRVNHSCCGGTQRANHSCCGGTHRVNHSCCGGTQRPNHFCCGGIHSANHFYVILVQEIQVRMSVTRETHSCFCATQASHSCEIRLTRSCVSWLEMRFCSGPTRQGLLAPSPYHPVCPPLLPRRNLSDCLFKRQNQTLHVCPKKQAFVLQRTEGVQNFVFRTFRTQMLRQLTRMRTGSSWRIPSFTFDRTQWGFTLFHGAV